MKWMVLPLRRYAEFNGRSQRSEFWMFMLLYALVVGVSFALMAAGIGSNFRGDLSDSALAGIVLLGSWWIGTFIPCMALSVRRLHDRDWSGAVYLVFLGGWFVPFISAFTFIGYFVVMSLPGTAGENRYGPDPRGGESLAEVFA